MLKKINLPRFARAAASLFLLVSISTSCADKSSSAAVESTKPEIKSEIPASSDFSGKQLKAAQNLIEKNPNSPKGYNALALAYIQTARETGDFSLNSKAETAVKQALKIDSANTESQKLALSLMLTFHRFDEALATAKQLQPKAPQDAFFYGVLTDANVELGNYAEAAEAVQQMVDLRPNMESYARVSHVRSLYGDAPGAIEAMNTAARIADPLNSEARAWCVVRLGDEYFKTGKHAEAEKQYDDALKIFPNYHLALAGKGRARAAAGDFDAAVKLLTETNNRVPNVENVILLGDVYTKAKKTDEAEKQYELARFIEQGFGNKDQRRLALLWADRDTNLDEALGVAERERAARKDIYTADVFAWCLYKKGRFQEAKVAMTEALRLKTKDAGFFYHAGMIEKELGNKKAAADYLNKALQTNPSFDLLQAERAKTALAELK